VEVSWRGLRWLFENTKMYLLSVWLNASGFTCEEYDYEKENSK
jgi:hypothetical protein